MFRSRPRSLAFSSAVAVAMGALVLLAFAWVANANETSLYGGSGCYGAASSGTIGFTANVNTIGCLGSDVFLSGTSDAGTLYGNWYDNGSTHVFYGATWSYGGHDMCYTQCNGYVNTASYW